MTTSTQPATTFTPPTSPKQQFIDAWTRENATTRRVLAALPDDQGEFRPNELCKTAREIAHIFTVSQGATAAALTNTWQWPPQFPKAPATYAEVVAGFDATSAAVRDALASAPESRWFETVKFFTAPREMGDVAVSQLLWFMLMDAIHHRGQLTIYLRMAGAKVPSIYGPTKDEPWM